MNDLTRLKRFALEEYSETNINVLNYINKLELLLENKRKERKCKLLTRSKLREIEIEDCSKFIDLAIKKLKIDVRIKIRDIGFNKPLWNRVIIYDFLTLRKSRLGSHVSKGLDISHRTGMHYRDVVIGVLESNHPFEVSKRMDILEELYKHAYKNSLDAE